MFVLPQKCVHFLLSPISVSISFLFFLKGIHIIFFSLKWKCIYFLSVLLHVSMVSSVYILYSLLYTRLMSIFSTFCQTCLYSTNSCRDYFLQTVNHRLVGNNLKIFKRLKSIQWKETNIHTETNKQTLCWYGEKLGARPHHSHLYHATLGVKTPVWWGINRPIADKLVSGLANHHSWSRPCTTSPWYP